MYGRIWAFFVALLVLGCFRASDMNYGNDMTSYSLTTWGDRISILFDVKFDFDRFKSSKEIRDYLISKELVKGSEVDQIKNDWWGNDYKFTYVKDGSKETVKIMSYGRDGVDDGGGGDDLFVEVSRNKIEMKTSIKLKKILSTGAE